MNKSFANIKSFLKEKWSKHNVQPSVIKEERDVRIDPDSKEGKTILEMAG